MKKILAWVLTLALLLGCCPLKPMRATAVTDTTVNSGEMAVQSTNGFGNLLAQDLEQEESERFILLASAILLKTQPSRPLPTHL